MAIASTTLREKSGYPSLDSDDDQGIKKTGSPKCSSHKDWFSEVLVAQGVNLVHEGMPVHQTSSLHDPHVIITRRPSPRCRQGSKCMKDRSAASKSYEASPCRR